MSIKNKLKLFLLNIVNLHICPRCHNEMKIVNIKIEDDCAVFECKNCGSILHTKNYNKIGNKV